MTDETKRAPNIGTQGQPFCSGTGCPMYDGKRCRETGFQPDSICEPAVIDIVRDRNELRARVERMEKVYEAAKEASAFLKASSQPGAKARAVLARIADAIDAAERSDK